MTAELSYEAIDSLTPIILQAMDLALEATKESVHVQVHRRAGERSAQVDSGETELGDIERATNLRYQRDNSTSGYAENMLLPPVDEVGAVPPFYIVLYSIDIASN